MDPDKVRRLYGGKYAADYNTIWQESPVWSAEAGHHLRTLGSLMGEGTRWLDVGCGTGWFLSKFPGVVRAGIDLSPDMYEQARAANPDALFIREGDIREDVPEWHDAWNLVTSTGQAWCYVDSMSDIEKVATNLARWTSPDGVCMVQPGDITDLTGLVIPYNFSGERPPPYTTVITGAIWSLYEDEVVHENLIWPSLDVWVHWLSRHFRHIEILHWPHDPPAPYLFTGRRVVLASQKRRDGDATPTEVIEHPKPEATATEDHAPADPPPAEAPAAVETPAAVAAVPVAGPPPRLYDRPLSDIVPRIRPWERRFWQSVRRRATRASR